MPDQKISSFDALTSVATGDLIPIVDVSDTTQGAGGSTKKITQDNLIPDSSSTVKGKVELATTAETETGTDATRAVTPDGLHDMTTLSGAAWLKDEDNMASDSAVTVPSQQSVKAYVDSGTVTMTNKTLTSPTITSPVVKSWTGWQLYDSVTPTYTSADDPTYVITFASVDLTSIMSVGMKVKFTNNSTTFYGFITALSFSTNTVMTLYGGTDYDVANSAISGFYFSTDRAPQGFPLDPAKWSVLVTDATQRSGAVSATTWTNVGSTNAQISIPIGIWDVFVKASAQSDRTSAGTGDGISGALSDANNTASDGEMMAMVGYYGSGVASSSDITGGLLSFRKTLTRATKATYYLNWYAANAGTVTQNITTYGGTMVLRATIAYL